MASRYWIGGTAAWDATNGIKWATTSGGAGGASRPGVGDSAFLDGNSGSGTVTLSNAECLVLDTTGFAGTITGSGITFYQTATIGSGTTATGATLNYAGSVSGNLTTNGKALSGLNALAVGGVGVLTLQDQLTLLGNMTVPGCGINTNGKTVIAAAITRPSLGTGIANFTIDNSLILLTGTATVWSLLSPIGLTFSATGSTIKIIDASSVGKTFAGNDLTYGTVWYSPGGSSDLWTSIGPGDGIFGITGSNTFAELKDDATVTPIIEIQSGSTQTITTFSINGPDGLNRISLRTPLDNGTTYSLVKSSGEASGIYLDIKDCIATGGATWTARNSVDAGNNTGWRFTPLSGFMMFF